MGISKLEAAINKVEQYSSNPEFNSIEWNELMADLGNKTYIDALNGKLFRKNGKGELVKVEVKGR
ncbi:hypothetical protein [Cellulosilyticum lentocellum]|uniref:Uncharacterized protein n=1 Tax=Cellulosilyticum lentocellum (strain ATCC 49066 / DSM 5427 / NCIMB 11756 / RHM5) TaxID=642492 RepID=F2JPJ2_CELLD|nr:hypothetical protein [Cellulosilyticum lentocellum]ADZ82540.1 hypothetical protein Clole_0807 [Cellulosilyticum lentocellum DSM 5427]